VLADDFKNLSTSFIISLGAGTFVFLFSRKFLVEKPLGLEISSAALPLVELFFQNWEKEQRLATL
jgi:hypothetical protein